MVACIFNVFKYPLYNNFLFNKKIIKYINWIPGTKLGAKDITTVRSLVSKSSWGKIQINKLIIPIHLFIHSTNLFWAPKCQEVF